MFKFRIPMPKIYVLSLFLLLSIAVSRGQGIKAGLPLVSNFNTLDYQAGIQNWDVTQDGRGLLYVANNFGLLEYDGNEWKTYPVSNGTKVRSVACDGRGRIYVGGQGDFGYFFPDRTGRLQFISLADSLPPADRNFDEAWSVYVDPEKVYFCTFSNIYVYDHRDFTIIRPTNGIDHSFLVNRELFVNQPLYGLGKLQGDVINIIPGGDTFAGKSIASVLSLHRDELLVATFSHGIFEYASGQVRPWNPAIQELLKQSTVNCMVRLRNGSIAIGTQYNGLFITDAQGNIQQQLTRGRGIDTRTVLSIYEDDLNNLWVGQNNGIAYVETGSPFTFINEQIGLPGSGYTALLANDRFYLGTNTGLYVQQADGGYQLIGNSRGQVYSLRSYQNDILAGHHNGSLRIEEDTSITISDEPGSWTFLQLSRDPGKLVGGNYSGLQMFHYVDGHWREGNRLAGFEESSRIMEQDDSGCIWVTHGYKGAFRIRMNEDYTAIDSVDFYGSSSGFPTNLLINVFRIRNELVFTSQNGLFKFDEASNRFVPHTFLNKYLGENNVVWFLEEDTLGNIYFISQDHIGVLKRTSAGAYEMITSAFGKVMKFLNDDLPSISVLQDNQVLYGGKDGFILYNPLVPIPQRSDFHTWIRRVSTDTTIFSGSYTSGDSVVHTQLKSEIPVLPYASNSLSFTFSANSFESGNDIQYQYHLENYDKGWLAWTPQTYKEYTNLKEGNYTFIVRARNIKGEVSSAARYSFTIDPPWYRSLWAYLFYGVSFLSLMFLGFTTIDRKYQKEQELLEEKQRQELDHKETQLEELSLQSQEEINRLRNEKLEQELRHMNSELATSTMHLLNKNEFITSIKGSVDHLIKKTQQDDLRKDLHQISRQIEQNISADDDWEHFQLYFDRVHGDFSNRFKAAFPTLSPQEIKLSAYLRMNLSTKEIAQLLNVSVRGVEISRYRLRKKLQLQRSKNLQEFILNF